MHERGKGEVTMADHLNCNHHRSRWLCERKLKGNFEPLLDQKNPTVECLFVKRKCPDQR